MVKKVTIADLAAAVFEVDRAAAKVLTDPPEIRPYSTVHLRNRREHAIETLRAWLEHNGVPLVAKVSVEKKRRRRDD